MNKPAPLAQVRVVLSHPSHPGNIGAAARAMKTMGLSQLVLVNPKRFPDSQADALASGALDVLESARVVETLDAALAGTTLSAALSARRRDLPHPQLTAREAARLLAAEARRSPVALVFGTEMSGLTVEEAGKCRLLVSIPANPEYSSLNLAAAVQVLAYELRMALDEESAPPFAAEPARFDEIEHFFRHLEATLVRIGFLDPQRPRRLMQRLRRLFARAGLEKEEVNILRGILNAMEKGYTDDDRIR